MDSLDKVQLVMNKISNNRYLKAISNGMVGVVPITLIGSIASILVTLPFGIWQNFLMETGLETSLTVVVDYTINFIALFIVFFIGRSLAVLEEKADDSAVIGIFSMLSFLILTPYQVYEGDYAVQTLLPFDYMGAKGIFSAIIVGLLVCKFYLFLKKHQFTIKLPETVPPMIGKSFEAIIPGCLLVGVAFFIQFIMSKTSFGNLHDFIYSLIQLPLQGIGAHPASMILAAILMPLLWFFGLHGTSIFVALLKPILVPMDMENLAAFTAGKELPNMFGFNFWMVFTSTQMLFGLVVIMCFAQSKRYKMIGRMGILPAFFGITEPITFGTPIVMNFKLFIPYVFSSGLSVTLAYFATILGIIPPANGTAFVLGVPPLLRALMQGSWKIMAMLAVNFVITGLIFYPFFRSLDKEALQEESASK